MKPNGVNTDIFYVYTDQIGAPRATTTNASTPVTIWSWDNNDPFGANTANSDPDGDSVLFTYNVRLPGQYFDSESGLHYNYFRDYDPAVGRYATSDPIGLRGGMNTFGYVGGEPNRRVDPTGEDFWVEGENNTSKPNLFGGDDKDRWLGGLHRSICVGQKPNGTNMGDRYCVSIGLAASGGPCDGKTFCGEIYQDRSHPGEIDSTKYTKTDKATDAKIRAYLMSIIGKPDLYILPIWTCRNFSSVVYEAIKKTYTK